MSSCCDSFFENLCCFGRLTIFLFLFSVAVLILVVLIFGEDVLKEPEGIRIQKLGLCQVREHNGTIKQSCYYEQKNLQELHRVIKEEQL